MATSLILYHFLIANILKWMNNSQQDWIFLSFPLVSHWFPNEPTVFRGVWRAGSRCSFCRTPPGDVPRIKQHWSAWGSVGPSGGVAGPTYAYTLHYIYIIYITLHYIYITLHYINITFTLHLHYIALHLHLHLHYIALHYIYIYIYNDIAFTLHYIYITLHYIYIALHYIYIIFTLHLHYITFTLHCITFTLHYIYIYITLHLHYIYIYI